MRKQKKAPPKKEIPRKKKRAIEKQEIEARGIIRMHPRGFGFVQLESNKDFDQDIFIPKHLTLNAVDGDTVLVAINLSSLSEKGPEGRVEEILTRKRTHIAGIVTDLQEGGYFFAYAPLLGREQVIEIEGAGRFSPKIGDRFVLEVIDWGKKEQFCRARFCTFIGSIDDPSCDVEAAIQEFQIRHAFSSELLDEIKKRAKNALTNQDVKRVDYRSYTTCTIDPDTAKDFDDAISIERTKKGYTLYVHIADVTAFVEKDSLADIEAKKRANSTYFPGNCTPMLPPFLSDDLCSLKPSVDRLAVTCKMDFDGKGFLQKSSIHRSIIHSNKRFTYKEALSVFQGESESEMKETLFLMKELFLHLKERRKERGSIEFSLPELVVLVDKKGDPKKVERIEYDFTHQIIEEFMVKANEVVATTLTKENKPIPYRIHDKPSEDSLSDFSLLASTFGFTLPKKPKAQDLQTLFEEAKDSSFLPHLSTSYIRRMRLAAYSSQNIGHYGLSLENYCHFTSPIRRYADLVVHRTLFEGPLKREDLEDVCLICSEQERLSAKAEQTVKLLKKLRLLKKWHEKERNRNYQAFITGVKPFGITFELIDLALEGFIHVSNLGSDYFRYQETNGSLVGDSSSRTFHPGQELLVKVKEIDLIFLECEWKI